MLQALLLVSENMQRYYFPIKNMKFKNERQVLFFVVCICVLCIYPDAQSGKEIFTSSFSSPFVSISISNQADQHFPLLSILSPWLYSSQLAM